MIGELATACWPTSRGASRNAASTSVASRRTRSAALMATPFLGAEELILLGVTESTLPMRSALRKVGALLRRLGEPATT